MTLPFADHQLTEAEIKQQYGALVAAGIEAMRHDPWLLVEIVERASAPGPQLRAAQRRVREAQEQARVERQRLQAERDIFLRWAFASGLSSAQAGEILGESSNAVLYGWRRLGLWASERRRAQHKSPEQIRREQRLAERDAFDVKAKALAGESLAQAAKTLGCSSDRVRASWVRQGIEFTTIAQSKAITAAILPLLDVGLSRAEIMQRLNVTASEYQTAYRRWRTSRTQP